MKRRTGKHPCRTFARIVRATRGTRPLPLDPLPSSLCSVFENGKSVVRLKPKTLENRRRKEKFLAGKRFGESLRHT